MALLLVTALTACGASATTSGTITGDVVAGPTCPVERISAPCPPEPVQNRQVSITTQAGALAATTTTDASGNFTVQVPPGNYVVQVKIIPHEVGLRQVTPGNVVVHAGETSTVHIELDTGIR